MHANQPACTGFHILYISIFSFSLYLLSIFSFSRHFLFLFPHSLSLHFLILFLSPRHFLSPTPFPHFFSIASPLALLMPNCLNKDAFLLCCFLLADSIYGICRERRKNLNIRVSRKYSWSKQLPRKPAKLCQPAQSCEVI